MNRSILFNFYQAIIQSILSSSILVWYGAATQQDLYKLNSVVKYCEKIVNLPLPSLENIYFERLEKKTNLILKDEYHPSRKYFNFLPSGRRIRHFRGNVRFLKSTYPQAVRYFNGVTK